MPKTIVFIHGAWLTPLCWEQFNGFFEAKGYQCFAPAWPYHDRPIDELRRSPDPRLSSLGVAEIVAHYASIIKGMAEPPLLIGHSFGGLFVQMLLDQGLGAAGVAIDSAPPKGVFTWKPTTIKSILFVMLKWQGWRRINRMSFKNFQYVMVHTLPEAEQRAAYERYLVPEAGRPFFQTALAMLNPKAVPRVNFGNRSRGPLLLIAGEKDIIIPASTNRANYRKYRASSATTAFKEFPNRVHWIIAEPGWDEVAGYIEGWLHDPVISRGSD